MMMKVGMVVTMRSSSSNAQKLGCSPDSSGAAKALPAQNHRCQCHRYSTQMTCCNGPVLGAMHLLEALLLRGNSHT